MVNDQAGAISAGPGHGGDLEMLHQLLGEWQTYLTAAGQSPRTIRLRLAHIVSLSHVACPLAASQSQLLNWLARPLAPESRKSSRSSLVAWFRWLIESGNRDDDPSASLPRVRIPRAVARPAPQVAVNAALLAADERDALMVMLAALAGLRRGEIARVRRDDIIDGSIRVTGKGGHVRRIPLHHDLASALDAEWARRDAGELVSRYGDPSSSWLFPGQADGTHVTDDVVGRRVARLLGPGVTAHQLRHRFATQAYATSRDEFAVQELLGHSKPETTRRYVQLPDDALRRAIAGVSLVA